MAIEKPDTEFDKALEAIIKRWEEKRETMPVSEKNPKAINISKLAKLIGQSRQTLNKTNRLGLERREKINAVALLQGLEPWTTTEQKLKDDLNSTTQHYKEKAAEIAKTANDAKNAGALSNAMSESLLIENLALKDEIEAWKSRALSAERQLNEFNDTGLIRDINRG